MSLEKAEKFLEDKGYVDRIILMDGNCCHGSGGAWS